MEHTKKTNQRILYTFLLLIPSQLLGFLLLLPAKVQYVLNDAHEQYHLYNYVKAIDLYEQAFRKKNTLYAAKRFAEAYSLSKIIFMAKIHLYEHDFQ